MHIHNLAGGLCVEVDKLLSSGCAGSLLVVGGQAGEERVDAWGNTVGLVDRLGLVGSVVLVVEVGDG